jgi:hypothetical protein
MSQNSLQFLLTQTGLAIAPLRAVKTPAQAVTFFQQLGYAIPPGAFGGALSGLGTQAGELVTSVQQLVNATDAADIATGIAGTFEHLVAIIDAIGQLHTAIKSGGGGALPNIDDLPRRLTDFLLLDHFDRLRPDIHDLLLVIGLIEYRPNPAAGQPMRLVNWDRFGKVLTAPGEIFDDVYKWKTDFDTDTFLSRLEGLMRSLTLPGGLYPQTDATRAILGNTSSDLQELRFPLFQRGVTPQTYAQFGITFSPAEQHGGQKKGVALLPYILGAANFQFNVCDQGELVFDSSVDIKGIGVVVRPPADAQGLLNLTGPFKASLLIRQKPALAQETVIVGTAGGTRLAVQGLGVSLYAQNPQGTLDLGVEAQLQALRLVINGGDGDGFLQKILSGLNVDAEASLAFGLSLLSGFAFQAGGQLAIQLPTHIDVGPVHIEGLRLVMAPTGDHFNLDAGINFSADLGPLQASIENIGITAALRFQQGNLGPADLGISFKPPNGVGLSIDAGLVQGGGYLYIDTDHGRYAGALQLVIADFLSVSAIGLIDTKMPDGSDGFSLLVIITADFGAGFQLGFGFTLLAVGGLLGLNRGMLFQPIMDGVRTNAISSVMFPQDVIANAPRIISDLQAFFPPQDGTFLIGPMAKLGWGEPTLVSLSLGVIIEIPPGDIAILGILRLALPADEIAILVMQVNFAGAFEVDKQRLYFFASLFDSHVLFITIDGGMGVLFSYGDDANFVVSIGGFHPSFNPPPLPFPTPQRIQFNIINESFARIQCDGYFAVTTNTVQFGTHSSYFFGFSALSVEGASGFDALIQFSPFHFSVEISTSFSVHVFGLGLFGIGIDLLLEGPTPFHAHGTASLSFLFFSIDIGIDFTWGDSRDTTLPPVAVMPILQGELGKLSNWRALLPAGATLLVSLRKLDPADAALVLHPVGTLQVNQRQVPLELVLDKFGNQRPTDADRFSLAVTTGGLTKTRDLQAPFAPAQFKNMDDAGKLSQPAYVPQDSGVELAVVGTTYASGTAITRIVRYDVTIIDTSLRRAALRYFVLAGALFRQFLRGSSAARSPLSARRHAQTHPFSGSVAVAPETFAVALTSSNTLFHPDAAAFTSQAAANDYVARTLAGNPNLAGTLHVLPQFEMAA